MSRITLNTIAGNVHEGYPAIYQSHLGPLPDYKLRIELNPGNTVTGIINDNANLIGTR